MDFLHFSRPEVLYSAVLFATEAAINKNYAVLDAFSNKPNVKLVIQPSPAQVVAFIAQVGKDFRRGKIINHPESFCEVVGYVGTMPKDLFDAAADTQYQLILAILERDLDAMKRLSARLQSFKVHLLPL